MSLQSTLKAILASQEAMQNQLEHILNRVDTLERSAKENTSLSSSCSSSDDQRRKRRLPSDLCVSSHTCNMIIQSVMLIFLNFLAGKGCHNLSISSS